MQPRRPIAGDARDRVDAELVCRRKLKMTKSDTILGASHSGLTLLTKTRPEILDIIHTRFP